MATVGWVDSAAYKAEWWDSPDQAELDFLLGVAHEVCLAYAPALEEGAPHAEVLGTGAKAPDKAPVRQGQVREQGHGGA